MTEEELHQLVNGTLHEFARKCSRDGRVQAIAFETLAAQVLATMRGMGGEAYFIRALPQIIEHALEQKDFSSAEGDAT